MEIISISEEVNRLASSCEPDVKARVVKTLADKIIDERVGFVLKGWEKRKVLMTNLRTCKPDIKSVTSEGVVEEKFSEQMYKKKRELEDKLSKLENSLEDALKKSDYEPLKKCIVT